MAHFPLWAGFVVLLSGVFTPNLLAQENTQTPTHTLFTKEEITAECRDAYVAGINTAKSGIENNIADKRANLDAGLKKISAQCHQLFSLGAFDFIQSLSVSIQTEYVLERWHAQQSEDQLISKPYFSRIRGMMGQRLIQAGLDVQSLTYWDTLSPKEFDESFLKFVGQIKSQVQELAKPIRVGRFIFTLSKRSMPMSAFEYAVDENFDWQLDQSGQPVLTMGSYQFQATFVVEQMKKIAKGYLEWRPGIVLSDDSFYAGALWRKSGEKSGREIKEEDFFRSASNYLRMALELGLDTGPFTQMMDVMNKKSKGFLEREIAVYDAFDTIAKTAFTLPITMYFAAGSMTYLGFKVLPYAQGATRFATMMMNSGKLIGGARLAYAANASAAVTLTTILGATTYRAATGIRDGMEEARELGQKFTIVHALDFVLISAVTSLPIAEQMTTLVGAVLPTGKMLVMGLPALMLKGWDVGKFMFTQGFASAGKYAATHSWNGIKWYATQWWNNKRLYLTDTTLEMFAITGIEVGTRQIMLGGDLAFFKHDESGNLQWWNPKYWNKESLVSLASAALVVYGVRPIPEIGKNDWSGVGKRLIIYRSISLTGSLSALFAKKAILDEDFDFQRFAIDFMYNIPTWGPLCEIDGRLKKSKFLLDRGKISQAAIKGMWFFSIHTADSFVYSQFIELVRGGALDRLAQSVTSKVEATLSGPTGLVMDQIRKHMHAAYGVDLSPISDAELIRSIHDYLQEDKGLMADLARLK